MDAQDIRKLRHSLGLSQVAFADKLGISSITVRRWEKRVCLPSPMARKLLDEMFGVDIDISRR